MQYHGIASYKLEYQLSTGGDWTTAVDTPNTSTSYVYTIEGLTGGKGYNLRATVTDRAGNSSTGTNTANTKKPEKNPGGIINDIATGEIIYPGQFYALITSNLGKSVKYDFTPKTVQIAENLRYVKASSSYSSTGTEKWFVLFEDYGYLYVTCYGQLLELYEQQGFDYRCGYTRRSVL